MKREFVIHLFSFSIFFLAIFALKGYFSLEFVPFFIGGLVGTALPDIDHLIYTYYLKPHELASQRLQSSVKNKGLYKSLDLFYATRQERKGLIFHSIWFQLLFLFFTFWVASSSGHLLMKGLTVAFSYHLLVDQFSDLLESGNLSNWLSNLNVKFTKESALLYWLVMAMFIFIFAFIFK